MADRIVLLARRFGRGSGTAGVAWHLARGLRDRGLVVEIWCDERTERLPGVTLHSGVGRAPRSGLRIGLDRQPDCDVLRCSGGIHERWRAVLRADPRRFFRGIGPSRTSSAEARAVATATRLVCNAQHVADDVMARHEVPAARVRVVRNGVDLVRFRPDPDRRMAVRRDLGVPPSGRLALFVAHGWFRKGFDAAVHGFLKVAGPHDRFGVMGRDSRSRRRLSRARSLLGERLVVAEGTDAASLLPGGDVLVHPTRYDASANVVHQAMACGVPPVTTLQDGAAEIIEDRRLIVANPDDDNAVAASIGHAWEAPGLGARC
ncbi:MAG: glycosyltransferase family 4 protein, partial [Myxococcota bacterium]